MMFGKRKLSVAAALALTVASAAQAANITAPFELQNAKTLPAGIRNPRFKNIFISMEDKFGNNGQALPLGQPLNKTVSWNNIIDAQDTQEDKNLISSTLSNAGIDPNGSPGRTTGAVDVLANVKVPILAWGLTDTFTVAAAVPVYSFELRAATGFVRSNDGQRFVDAVCSNASPTKCNDAANKLNNAINQKLTHNGYEPVSGQTIDGVGDIKLVGKYVLPGATEENRIAIQPVVTLPTGIAPNVNRAVDLPTGDGQVDVGVGVSWDRSLTSILGLNVNAAYTNQLPDKMYRRVPKKFDDTVSDEIALLDRDSGDQVVLGTGLTLGNPAKGFSLGGGYTFQFQGKTGYGSSYYSRERMSWVEGQAPVQLLHSATLTATFATIDWFKEGKFFYPFQAVVAYSMPLLGRNVVTSNVLAAELVMFF